MSVQTYNVPLVLTGLRKEESINQIVDSLEYLEKVSNDIFSRISRRVSENKNRLAQLDHRVDVAQARIDKIKGTKKATRVFSSNKYPAPEKLEDYRSLYQENDLSTIKRQAYRLNSKFSTVDEKTLKEKLQFYNVHLNTRKKDDTSKSEGLGSLPRNLQSVSSLLLFNTTENPYKKYVMLDPLAGAVTKTRANIEEEDESIGEAPVSIMQGVELDRFMAQNYFYVPNLGEVPEINVALNLPDLPGIADDIAYR